MDAIDVIIARILMKGHKIIAPITTRLWRIDSEPEMINSLSNDKVMSSKSSIPNAGNGLFAIKDIKKGEIIFFVKGKKYSIFTFFLFAKDLSHAFTLSTFYVLVPDGDDLAQMANHHFDASVVNAITIR